MDPITQKTMNQNEPPTPSRSAWECQSMADAMRAKLEIYRPKELAAKLGVSRDAVRNAIKSGQLNAKRINSRVYLIESGDAARWWVNL